VKLDSRRRENNAHPEKGRMKEHTPEREGRESNTFIEETSQIGKSAE
jgi:hypothetical protein